MKRNGPWCVTLVVVACICLATSAAAAETDPEDDQFGVVVSDFSAARIVSAENGGAAGTPVFPNQENSGLVRPLAGPVDWLAQSTKAAVTGAAASTVLTELGEDDRANARIDVELFGEVRSTDFDRARTAEQLWAAGDHSAAISMIRQLEENVGVAIGIEWKTPLPSESTDFMDDARLGTRLDATMVALDYDAASGHLFAVVHFEESQARWAVYISTNGGASWEETYSWGTSGWADGVVAGDWFWVAYQFAGNLTDGRMRRFNLVDGSVDPIYDFQTIINLTIDIDEIVLFSDADEIDNRIYYAFIASDNTMRVFWDLPGSGTTFVESSVPSPIVNADSGLDWHWNEGSSLTRYTWASYVGTDAAIHVWRWDPAGWTEMDTVSGYSGNNLRTKISAYADTVIFAYEDYVGSEWTIPYRISYNGGDTWAPGTLGPGPEDCLDFDVTARGGVGTAGIYGREVGEPDEVNFKSRAGYGPGSWTIPEVINQHDIITGTIDMEINWLGSGYGTLYIANGGMVYFDRSDMIFGDGFELGSTAAWSATVP